IGGSHASADEHPVADSHVSRQPGVVLHFHVIADQGGVIHRHVSSDDAAGADFTLFSDRCAVTDQSVIAYLDVVIDHGVRTDDATGPHFHLGRKVHWPSHRADSARRLTDICRRKDLHVVADPDSVFDDYERVYDDVVPDNRPAADYRVLTNHDIIAYPISLNDGERTNRRIHLRSVFHLFSYVDFRVSIDVIDVLAIVAVIIIAVLTDIEVIKCDSEDPGPHGGKVLASAAHRFAFAFSALDHEDYAVYEGRKDYRVAHADHRRRVYDDVIEAFTQRAKKLFHTFRTYQFGRVGRHVTTWEDRESPHGGSNDELIRIAAARQEGG